MSNILDILSSDLDSLTLNRNGLDERDLILLGDTNWAIVAIAFYELINKNGFLSTPDGVWEEIGRVWETDYISALENKNPSQLLGLARNFFRNELSAGIVSHLLNRSQSGIDHESLNGKIICDLIACTKKHPEVQLSQLEIPPIGNPYGLAIGHHLIVPDAPRHFSHAKKIAQLTQDIEFPKILEIGAGYGGVLYMLQSLMGNKKFQYTICDLECVLLIALYFLQSCRTIRNWDRRISLVCNPGDLDSPEIADADIVLIPAGMSEVLSCRKYDLVYNANSFSEMSLDTLKHYFDLINVIAEKYLFLMANTWESYAFDKPITRLTDFPIGADYKVSEWSYAPWISGVGRSKEVVYERKQ